MNKLFDHVNLQVSDLEKSKEFYTPLLALLDIKPQVVEQEVIGFGREHWEFGLEVCNATIPPTHLAFAATSHDLVKEFYQCAITAGGRDNGAPGLRPEYGPGYFAAFVLDPDGNNIEIVFREG